MPESFVDHIVLLKLARPLEAGEIAKVKELAKVPGLGVQSVSCGENYTTRGQGFNYAIVVRFENQEAEKAYQTHPEHVKLKETVLKPLIKGESPLLAIDFVDTRPVCPFGMRSFTAMGFAAGAIVGACVMKARN
mmetsp:Transcript_49422/g.105538  ORF Transcript_49422/g.105538 Transcript_49422/m.105538 type:complete len:134 (-) Transcript_49422:364-765(-)|eukprot:CAMPEP_0183336242 /NCGR_PEP_ID=MMETSP0164_2-20130417/4276_1 /TAXON_ID=221442 /ORGANISM="Coccolithus pelagicus ssp braarudi, Strain PLY182g" /LENGTH=133 /DNA_ID=CAMNT_0025505723 /DNA_START=118 /DNA_END=519 /DNA_ORIENTATION=-